MTAAAPPPLPSRLPLPLRLALNDLRGGIAGLRVFLLCLAVGVAAIAAVGSLRDAISTALGDQGAALLGGDAQITFTYRFASAPERAFIKAASARMAELADFRSMVVLPDGSDRALTQVKAVDDAYPLAGPPLLDPPIGLAAALAGRGAVMEPVLAARLGLKPGDGFRMGSAGFTLRALILREPDAGAGGMTLAPRTILRLRDLDGAGLLGPGSLFDSQYRMILKPGADLAATETEAKARFAATGLRWQDRRHASPGTERFVQRMADFLVLVGIAALAVGGIGIAAAVGDWLARRTAMIATLKVLGAGGRTIRRIFAAEVALVGAAGIALGLAAGAALPLLGAPWIGAALPVPVSLGPSGRALAEAALYGALTAALFTVLPLAGLDRVRAAALFRAPGEAAGRPAPRALALAGLLLAALVAASAALSGAPGLALWSLAALAGALALLWAAALGLRRLARRLAGLAAGRPALRLALAALGSPGGGTVPAVLAIGLGIAVLSALGQIDANLRRAIAADLPRRAPAYFLVDIQPDQIGPFLRLAKATPGVTRIDSAPMLRGIMTRINGADARSVAGDHWVLRGDRGVSFAQTPPPDTRITAGRWWTAEARAPEVSFAATEAAELGLRLGDRLTVNILGRDIEATLTSLRAVDFSSAGIGFVMVMNPAALAGAPHTNIATLYTGTGMDEGAFLRTVGARWPNISAIRVTEVIARVTEALGTIASASAIAAGVTLVAGGIVLVGTAAAGEPARRREAAILRTLGATRRRIRASLALRAALTGAAAGLVATLFGAAAGWAVMHFVMEAPFRFAPLPAILAVAGGALAVLAAGLAFAEASLGARPARVLRAND